MSTESRRKSTPVIKRLQNHPYEFTFDQAVRLLERSTRKRITTSEKAFANPVARYMPPTSEFVRFNTRQSLSFPSTSVYNVKATLKNGKIGQWNMDVSFIGLTGSNGVLPYHYTETVLKRLKQKDKTIANFFNLFNHRTTSLFYQSSSKYNFPIEYERARLRSSEAKDSSTRTLLSLIGFGTSHVQNRLVTKDESLVYYAGLLTQKVRTATGLKQIIQNHFSIPVEIREFIGQWQELINDVRTKLPGISSDGQNHCLGRSVVLGRKGWFAQGKVSIILGPLSTEQLYKFAPGTTTLKALNEIVRLYIGIEHDYDFIMRIKRKNVPERVNLSTQNTAIVGWNTWLSTSAGKYDYSDETVDIPVSSRRLS